MLGLLFQLEHSQWLAPERLRERQLQQLGVLLKHAYATVPLYGHRWRGIYDTAAPLTPERFAALPVLARADLRDRFDDLRSRAIPATHGALEEAQSGSSTGVPVRIVKTQLVNLLWMALTLRDHAWHRRDLRGKLAAVRIWTSALQADNWGVATRGLVRTGPAVVRSVDTDAAALLDWLEREQPDYLLCYPSLVAELARQSIARGVRLAHLREVRTLGEAMNPEVRDLSRQAWGAAVADVYSAEETGYLAIECPEHGQYHVQSEGALVEILDEHGQPCAPGREGRVVVTTLHNFAMPLIRYDLGDYAEFGEPCACGRGLPVLRRILGRARNMLVTASGKRYWPKFGARTFTDIAPVLQYQLAQKQLDLIEVRLVTAAPLAPEAERALRERLLAQLPAGLSLQFTYCDKISRSASGKYEDFLCEIAHSQN